MKGNHTSSAVVCQIHLWRKLKTIRRAALVSTKACESTPPPRLIIPRTPWHPQLVATIPHTSESHYCCRGLYPTSSPLSPTHAPSGGKPRAPLAKARGRGATATSRRSAGIVRMATEKETEKDGVAMEASSDVSYGGVFHKISRDYFP